ncbi:MAG: hypothetical protein HQ583_01815 [Candidatus Abyssubacteria bacterium]|nr:hypothetical protein [Candidatus Abyssubacteria bacterium]
MKTKTREYTHIRLNEEVTAIGGYYVLEKEVRLPFHGEEVLYVVGMGLVDNSCCAPTGCKYAIVPGYILEWRHRTNHDDLPVTEVQPIRDDQTRKEITTIIKEKELVQQVEFN